ncbi:MAG: LysM peptidoglycan-binding domain-containing protein [Chloroflexota bacterium]|nr:LysM peptidoglycan-binding domain-containing protein [Chloroflexota bacterium]
MTRNKLFPLFVLVLLIVTLPLSACNLSAVSEVEDLDALMSEAAAETAVPTEDTVEPTEAVTEAPTEAPTEEPTLAPTEEPTLAPTEEPTTEPGPISTEEPTAQPVVIAGPQQHVVQSGENLFRIALNHGVTLESLAQANGITNPAFICVGQVLIIPGGGTPVTPPQPQPGNGETSYVVQPGENLFRIALKYNLDYFYLAQYNNIANPAAIYAGQQLRIPLQ